VLSEKIMELQTESNDLKIHLKRFTDVTSTSSTTHMQNLTGRTGSGSDIIPSYQQQTNMMSSYQYKNHDFHTHSYHNNTFNLICTYCMKRGYISTSCFVKKIFHAISYLKWVPKHHTNI